jgi:hypothetical protein
MPRRAAISASLVILATMFAGLILMSFGEPTYRDLERRVLIALPQDPGSGFPA